MPKCLLNGCNKEARKKFCCNKHKDKYHNRHNPRGRYAHLADNVRAYDTLPTGYGHPFASGDEGHGQE